MEVPMKGFKTLAAGLMALGWGPAWAESEVDKAAPLVAQITKMPDENKDKGESGGVPWWFQGRVVRSADPRYAVGSMIGANCNRLREPRCAVFDQSGNEVGSYFDMKVGWTVAMFCVDAPGKFYRTDQDDPWTHTCGVLKQVSGDGGGGEQASAGQHKKKHKKDKRRRRHDGRDGHGRPER